MGHKYQNKGLNTYKVCVIVVLCILISIQSYATIIPQGHATYVGIMFGTEAQVSSDGENDIWQVDKVHYNYIAKNQTKPEVDLRGLFITRGINQLDWSYENEVLEINSTNKQIDYIYNFSFIIPLAKLENITLTFRTNQTFDNSAIEFYNWTDDEFYNESVVQNVTNELILPQYYSMQNLSIHFNISHSENFVFLLNITFNFWAWVDQIISIEYNTLSPGNSSLVGNLSTWVFMDMNGDDKLEYAIKWIYGRGAFLYNVSSDSFTLGGWWNGTFSKMWTGANWRVISLELRKNIGILETNRLNLTFPSYLINLTSSVRYAVWSQETDPSYEWWDALPDDPNWQISLIIPGFQIAMLALSLVLIGVIFLLKRKNTQKLNKIL